MKAIDYRNATWDTVRELLAGRRLAVYSVLAQHGPCTTRELAERSGIDLLAIRPRITELTQLGFVTLLEPADPERPGHEGTYRAEAESIALGVFLTRQAEAATGQLTLKLPD